MKAIVSPSTGVAVLQSEESLESFHITDPESSTSRKLHELHLLFGAARDIEILTDVTRTKVTKYLSEARHSHRALQLVLMTFDPELSDALRVDAAKEADEALSNKKTFHFVRNTLYSRPVPSVESLDDVLQRTPHEERLQEIIVSVRADQPHIRRVCRAWDIIPNSDFQTKSLDESDRDAFGVHQTDARNFARYKFVNIGIFHHFASQVSKTGIVSMEQTLAKFGASSELKGIPNIEHIFGYWVNSLSDEAQRDQIRKLRINSSSTPFADFVCIIEGDKNWSDLLETELAACEVRTEAVRTWQDGLAVCQSQRVDVVLVHLGLPGMNGPELVKVLDHGEQSRRPAIIALSTEHEDNVRSVVETIGASMFIRKPTKVLTVIDETLRFLRTPK